MIIINYEKCTACGVCLDICHESCMRLYDDRLYIDYELCSTCTHCIAVCPHAALAWDETPSVAFQDEYFPSSLQMEELLKQRRTNRYFKEKVPDRAVIEEIINYGAYAPTHSHNFRVIVIDDPHILKQIDGVVFSYNQRIYRCLYKSKIISGFIQWIAPMHKAEYLKAKPKLENSIRIRRAYKSLPPVIVFVVSLKRTPLSLASAQYIIYNMDLYARTKGLGGRILVGNQMFMNGSKALRKLLGIKKYEKIFAVLGLGYSKFRFKNKVEGRKIEILWK